MTKITPSALFNTMPEQQTDHKPSASTSHKTAFDDLLLNQLFILHKSHVALHGQRNMNSPLISNPESTGSIAHKNAALGTPNQEITSLYPLPLEPAAVTPPIQSTTADNQISPPVIALNSQTNVAKIIADELNTQAVSNSAHQSAPQETVPTNATIADYQPQTYPLPPNYGNTLTTTSSPSVSAFPETLNRAPGKTQSLLTDNFVNPAISKVNNNAAQDSSSLLVGLNNVKRANSDTSSPLDDLTTTTTLLSKTVNTTNSNEQPVANPTEFFDNAAAYATANLQMAPQASPVNTITNPNNVQSFSITPAFGESDWPNALSVRVQWMAQNNLQTARLTINPEHLGPIHIQVQMNNQQASIQFFSAQPEVREALQASIPVLSNTLAQEGIQLTNSSVSPQGFFSSDSRQSPSTSPSKVLRSTTTTATADSTSIDQSTASGLGLINLYI